MLNRDDLEELLKVQKISVSSINQKLAKIDSEINEHIYQRNILIKELHKKENLTRKIEKELIKSTELQTVKF
jgi:hypothetical protein